MASCDHENGSEMLVQQRPTCLLVFCVPAALTVGLSSVSLIHGGLRYSVIACVELLWNKLVSG